MYSNVINETRRVTFARQNKQSDIRSAPVPDQFLPHREIPRGNFSYRVDQSIEPRSINLGRIPPPPPLPGIRIMQPSFFTRSRNEDTDVRKIYLWNEIWRRGQSKRNIPSFETRAANAALLSLLPPLPLHSALETQFPNFLSLSFVCDSSKRMKSNS